jgi:hypothetical protein
MRSLVVFIVLISGCDSFTCIADADCEEGYACRPELDAERLDAVTGCVDRCVEDEDCSAGGVCLTDGTCG